MSKIIAVGLKLEVPSKAVLTMVEDIIVDAVRKTKLTVLDSVTHPDPDVIFPPPEDSDTCATCGADLLWDDSARMYYCPNTWKHG